MIAQLPHTSRAPSSHQVTGYTTVSSSAAGESAMASYVGSTGPLAAYADSAQWQFYTGGVLTSCGQQVDHAVQVVGIDTEAGYWKVRNSWGTSWGEAGFIRLALGANTCAIATDASFTNATTYIGTY